jgi:hypothetical protein
MDRFLNLRTPTPYPTGRPFEVALSEHFVPGYDRTVPNGHRISRFPGLQFDYEKKNRLLKGELIEFIDDVRPRSHFGFGPDGRGHLDEREGSDCRARSG